MMNIWLVASGLGVKIIVPLFLRRTGISIPLPDILLQLPIKKGDRRHV